MLLLKMKILNLKNPSCLCALAAKNPSRFCAFVATFLDVAPWRDHSSGTSRLRGKV